MLGLLTKCPHCGTKSSFILEEMECDKSLVAWCTHCFNYINQTFTLETFRRWWARYENGEESIKPPISKEKLEKLVQIEEELKNDPECFLDRVEIHFKDFTDYCMFSDEVEIDEGKADS